MCWLAGLGIPCISRPSRQPSTCACIVRLIMGQYTLAQSALLMQTDRQSMKQLCHGFAGCQSYLGTWVQGLPRCDMTRQDYVAGTWRKLDAECAPANLEVSTPGSHALCLRAVSEYQHCAMSQYTCARLIKRSRRGTSCCCQYFELCYTGQYALHGSAACMLFR